MHESSFIPLFSLLGQAFRTELPVTNSDCADLAEKSAAVIAGRHGAVSRMKETNSLVLVCELNLGRREIRVECRKNIDLELRETCGTPRWMT
jgi:hypothetical protein